jgi:NADH:ubiquinone oxidoreductase subunit C
MQLDEALVITYFLRSFSSQETLLLRGSLVPKNQDEIVEMPSMVGVWPMGEPMEREIEELFGFRFVDLDQLSRHGPGAFKKLPEGWSGFPLRKSYRFPEEVGEISHRRPTSRSPKDGTGHG